MILPLIFLYGTLDVAKASACSGNADETCAARHAVLQDELPADGFVQLLQKNSMAVLHNSDPGSDSVIFGDPVKVAETEPDAAETLQEHANGDMEEMVENVIITANMTRVVPPKPMRMSYNFSEDHITLHFLSVVPTFGPVDNYIAFIHLYDDKLWALFKDYKMYCAGRDKSHRTLMRLVGGESAVDCCRRVMVWHCDWPKEEANQSKYDVFIEEADGKPVGHVRTSYSPQLLGDHHTMACVPPVVFESAPSNFPCPGCQPTNSVRMLPQWLEHHLMSGVEHFLFYTFDDTDKAVMDVYQPYLDAGLATRIHMVIPDHLNGTTVTGWTFKADDKSRFNSGWTANDCLYRTKNHAKWLLPYIDVDEFMRTDSGDLPTVFDKMQKAHKNETIHSLVFDRYIFLRPQHHNDLVVSSNLREADYEPPMKKYVVNPSAVNALYLHFPTSWAPGTVAIDMPGKRAVINHYRSENATMARSEDPHLTFEARALQKALEMRFGMKWETLAAKLEVPKNLPPAPSHSQEAPFPVTWRK